MAIPLKITAAQHRLLMNDPIHYDLSMRFSEKEQTWECECDAATAQRVKAIIDEPVKKKPEPVPSPQETPRTAPREIGGDCRA